MTAPEKKPLMRSLGEFFGYIIKGVKTNPSRKVLKKTVEEEKQADNIVLRRTTIEEIEIRKPE